MINSIVTLQFTESMQFISVHVYTVTQMFSDKSIVLLIGHYNFITYIDV